MWPWAKLSTMGGDQAANVLAQVNMRFYTIYYKSLIIGKTRSKH